MTVGSVLGNDDVPDVQAASRQRPKRCRPHSVQAVSCLSTSLESRIEALDVQNVEALFKQPKHFRKGYEYKHSLLFLSWP